ncbi:MAG: HAD family hydrolase [Bacteroidales bacterium]|nr:HAD family hydrolase [Bacteroidales bacterium]
MSKIKYNYIVWDWNGTLFDDLRLCVDIMNNILKRRNLQSISIERYKQVFDFPVKAYYQKLGFDFEKESFENLGTEFIEGYNQKRFECKLHDSVHELLHLLQGKGVKQFILSAREHNKLLDDLKYFAIYKFIEDVSGLDNHFAGGKVQLAKKLLQKHNIPLTECVLIGDTVHDAEVAKKVGIDCILVSYGHQSYERLSITGLPTVHSFSEIANYL